ncbi:MAG: hypothetical protein V2A77_07370 [Pseudomonadota bacterium]
MRLSIICTAGVLAAVAGTGCAMVLPMVGTVATMGIDYNGKNCPSRTFTCELSCVHDGVLDALNSMSMKVVGDSPTDNGRKVEAQATGLDVCVSCTQITDTTTKVDVTAKKDVILRDGATAREILAQVEESLARGGSLQGTGAEKTPSVRPERASGRQPASAASLRGRDSA